MVGKHKYIDVYFLSRNLVARNTLSKNNFKNIFFPPNDKSPCTEGNNSCQSISLFVHLSVRQHRIFFFNSYVDSEA